MLIHLMDVYSYIFVIKCHLCISEKLCFYTVYQRRSEDYTDMQRGQARFFTYYRFLALRRHCSVGFRCVYASRFQEIQNRFIEKKL